MVHRVRSQKIFLTSNCWSRVVQMGGVVSEFRMFAQKGCRKVEFAKSGLDGLVVEFDHV